jgi:excisionase family DNA binding protein
MSQRERARRAEQSRRDRGQQIDRVCLTVAEWVRSTGLSKQTTYRMMADGRLRFVQFGRTRRIPTEEQVRLGLVSA